MGWLRRWLSPRSARQERESDLENIIVISDVHLGEDLSTTGPEYLSDHIRALNRELAGFVAAHGEDLTLPRPWHLVINGDLFDFVKVSLRREPEEALADGDEQPEPEQPEQMRNTAEVVVWKLGRILEIHRPLFKELGRFILNGHRITILEGNHDAEFYFEEVRDRLRDFLVDEARKIHRREKLEGEFDPEVLGEAVQFHPWFEASAGRYHIEHGHQYDDMCSFEYNLAPVDRARGEAIATPMSHRLMPYFSELLGDFSTHGVDAWGFARWMKFGLTRGPRQVVTLFRVYFEAMWELLGEAGRKRRRSLGAVAPIHAVRLEAMALNAGYSYQTLRELEGMRALPAEYSVFKMARVFYLDRFLIIGAIGLATGVGALLGGPTGWTIALVAIGLGLLALHALAKVRVCRVEDDLRDTAARIADKTGARYVVFGHSHRPELVNLTEAYSIGRFGEAAFYINSGSWVTRELVLGEKGKGMTFVEISEKGAFLKRWLGPKEEAEILHATGSAGAPAKVPEPPEGPTIEPVEEPAA